MPAPKSACHCPTPDEKQIQGPAGAGAGRWLPPPLHPLLVSGLVCGLAFALVGGHAVTAPRWCMPE
jgi:hypothetical protein